MNFKNFLKLDDDFDISLITLNFKNKNLENKFNKYNIESSISYQRVAIIVAVFFYALFGLLDAQLFSGEVLNRIYLLRYAFGVPITLLLFILSYFKIFIKYWNTTISAMILSTGISMISIMINTPAPIAYYNYPGLMLVLFYSSVVLRLRFIYSIITGLLLVIIYGAAARTIIFLPDEYYFNNMFFFVTTFFMGVLASYMIELYNRRDFFLNIQLNKEKDNVKNLLENEKSLNIMKSRFINVTSHVFRNPLTAIINSAELVKGFLDKNMTEKANFFNNYIMNSANEILNVLNRIQFITRYQALGINLNLYKINIKDLINNAINKTKVSELNSVQYKLLCNDDIYFTTDIVLLEMALAEILSNATKFSPKNSTIEINYSLNNSNELIISVCDNGPGLDETIFDKFQQTFNFIEDTKITGMGLGFVIINICLILLSGKINISKNQNLGSCVSVILQSK